MGHIDSLDLRNPSKAFDLAIDLLKEAGGGELAHPGLGVLSIGHVVVGVVAGNDHQGAQDDLGVARLVDGLDDVLAGGLLGLALHGADEHVLVTQLVHHGLHLGIGHLGKVGRAMAHEHQGGAVLLGGFQGLKASHLHGLGHHGLGHGLLVGIDLGSIRADLAQQGLGNDDIHLVGIGLGGLHQLVVLGAVHQMGGLDEQVLHAVQNGTIQGLGHVVDELAVPGLDMVDDDLSGEGAADGPAGEGFLQGLFDAADVLGPAAVEGGAEAHHQQLIFADAVQVPGVVQLGVAGIAAKVVGIGFFAFHQFLLLVGEGVPGGLGGGALGVGVIRPLLDIDGVDEGAHPLAGRFSGLVGGSHGIDGGLGVVHIQLLDGLDPAQARDLAIDLLKEAGGGELAHPGLGVLSIGHVVVGVVAGNDHQGAQDDLGVARLVDGLDDVLAGGLLGLALHGADEHVLVAQLVHHGLHLGIGHLGGMGRAMAHEHDGGAVLLGGMEAGEARFLHGLVHHGQGHGLLVVVHLGGVLAHLAQQGLGHGDGFKLVGILLHSRHQLVVLGAVHQMGGLHQQVLHAVADGALQGLVHVVDELAVTGLDVVDDDLGGEGAANGPIGEGRFQGGLNAADVLSPAVVEGRAEAHHQQLILSDAVPVPRIILGGVAGVAAKVVGIGILALHQRLLCVGQGIPGGLGGGAVGVGGLGPLLDIDGVDEGGHLGGGFLIGLGGLVVLRVGGGSTHHADGGQHDESQKQCDRFFHRFLLFSLERLGAPRCICSLHQRNSRHEKSSSPFGKETAYKRRPGREHGTQSIPRDLEITFPYPQTAGFLACGASSVAFPVSQWPRPKKGARRTFPHTVTRSHRPCTCFPFTPCASERARAPTAVIQFLTLYPHPSITVKRNDAHWLESMSGKKTVATGGCMIYCIINAKKSGGETHDLQGFSGNETFRAGLRGHAPAGDRRG